MDEHNLEVGKIVVPGLRLAKIQNFVPGAGTYEKAGYIHAMQAGELNFENTEDESIKRVVVKSPKTPSIIPRPGNVVTAKVTMVNSRMAHCVIMCVDKIVLSRTYRGIIKKEDIRATEKDRIDTYKCYRPGDIILAKILPMTEIHLYQLTTAEDELGVAIAFADGAPPEVNMVPISWTEMQCPKTLVKEPRKVAKILPEKFDEESLMPFLSKYLVSKHGSLFGEAKAAAIGTAVARVAAAKLFPLQ